MQNFNLPRRLAAEALGTALLVATVVGSGIMTAYWFTASTSFANPAVAIARSMTNTFSRIRPQDLPGFIIAEISGAIAALLLMSWLLQTTGAATPTKRKAML